jgi:glycosyltransferase involved in cell wall biosynthesis
MANYNNVRFIDQAVQSVVNQTFEDWELIIVDDASTDNSVEKIKTYLSDVRIRLIQHPQNRRYTAALKTGIANVKSDYFGILDSDDCLLLNAVETMYQQHINNPDCGLIYSQFVACDENLAPTRLGFCKAIPAGKTNLDVNCVSHFKTFKLQDYLKTSGYDESVLYAEDKDISYKLEEVTRLKFVNQPLYLYRELPTSIGHAPITGSIGRQSMQAAKAAAMQRRAKTPVSGSLSPRRAAERATMLLVEKIRIFMKAQQAFDNGNFVDALRLITQYQTQVDYSSLPVIDRRSEKASPRVSVIITAQSGNIAKLLNSLSSQTVQNFETIVVSNNDADIQGDVDKVDCIIPCPINFGRSEGRNIGAWFARGQIIVFLNENISIADTYIASIIEAFKTSHVFSLCSTSAFILWAWRAAGGYDPLLSGDENADLLWRMIRAFNRRDIAIDWPTAACYHNADSSTSPPQQNQLYLRHKHNTDIFADATKIQSPASSTYRGLLSIQQNNKPLVTVYMGAYNAEKYIREAMDSVLMQSFRDFELLIIDDGSADRTAEIVGTYKDSRIRFIRQDHKNFAAVMNRAIAEARGEFVIGVDSDDTIEPNYLEVMVNFAAAHPGFDYYYPASLKLNDPQKQYAQDRWDYQNFEDNRTLPAFLFINGFSPIANSGSLKRKELFAKTGLYRDLDAVEDFDFLTRNALKIRFKRVDGAAGYHYRINPAGNSHRFIRRNQVTAQALEEMVKSYAGELLCPPLQKVVPLERDAKYRQFVSNVFQSHANRNSGRGGEIFAQYASKYRTLCVGNHV